jgi:hypothetical protein
MVYVCKTINHKTSERGMYLHAIALEPNRPEAYYLLSQFFVREYC